MNSQAPVINVSGDYEEVILRLAKHLGRDKNRRAVFDLIYGRGSKPRSKKQIAEQLGKTGSAQVIQNALDALAKHHLVVRIANKGQVKDGSLWLYGKDLSVRANRDKIVKYADNPAAAKRVPTKRSPAPELAVSLVKAAQRPSGRRARRSPGLTKRALLRIALLVTNPERDASLQTIVEARDIQQAIRLANRPGEIDIKLVLAPTIDSLLDLLNSYRPDIIHFSGHGGGKALLFDNARAGDDGGTVLDFEMVARVVEATSAAPKLLVLAACDTVDGAERFLKSVPAVIAMANSIDDEAACEFSARFYRSLSDGATISQSLRQAKLVLESKGYADAKLPTVLSVADKAVDRPLIAPVAKD